MKRIRRAAPWFIIGTFLLIASCCASGITGFTRGWGGGLPPVIAPSGDGGIRTWGSQDGGGDSGSWNDSGDWGSDDSGSDSGSWDWGGGDDSGSWDGGDWDSGSDSGSWDWGGGDDSGSWDFGGGDSGGWDSGGSDSGSW